MFLCFPLPYSLVATPYTGIFVEAKVALYRFGVLCLGAIYNMFVS